MRQIVRMKRAELEGFPGTHQCPECGEIYQFENDGDAYCDWWDCEYTDKLDKIEIIDDEMGMDV